MSRNPNQAPRRHTGAIIVLILIILALIAGSGYMIKLCLDIADRAPEISMEVEDIVLPTLDVTEPTETVPPTTLPEPEHVVSTATIASTGDLLMHKPVIDTCRQKDGTYNFESVFRYLTEYSSAADYAVANLETTLYGTGKPYAGFPNFNCPDEIIDGAKEAGFDMLLNANNHSYDTGSDGMHRTISIIKDRGLDYTGIADTEEEVRYLIKDINDIKIGMICYTYETNTSTEKVALNGLPVTQADAPLVNAFDYNNLDIFYNELAGHLESMEAEGAEATILYIHWGVEYLTYANDQQKAIAQKLCDMGIDVIVGGHPHVIQPVELLTSTTDENHKTVCLYSMGNAVSNQRLGNIKAVSTAHTEDGLLFSVTFEKYSDGTVYLQGVDLLPCWVYRRTDNTGNEYNILPLDMEKSGEWETMFNFPTYVANNAQRSYERTMKIVGEGMTAAQTYLEESKAAREEYYYNLAFFPEKFATEPTEAATEAATEAPTEGETTPTE